MQTPLLCILHMETISLKNLSQKGKVAAESTILQLSGALALMAMTEQLSAF